MARGSKETIKRPTKRELSDASTQLRRGHPSGGRTMADMSVWVRQHSKRRREVGPPSYLRRRSEMIATPQIIIPP